MPAIEPCWSMKCVARASGSKCRSLQTPRSCGEMRPSGVTAAASVKTRPAPPMARLARCTKCQSFAMPSREEYWHIGETPMRLWKVMSRRRSSSNRWGMGQSSRVSQPWIDNTERRLLKARPLQNRPWLFSGKRRHQTDDQADAEQQEHVAVAHHE